MTSVLRSRLERLPSDQQQKFFALLKSGRTSQYAVGPVRPAGLESTPLASPQMTLWLLSGSPEALARHHTVIRVRFDAPVDGAALLRTVDGLAARHDTLRTALPDDGDGPVQRVSPAGPVHLTVATPVDIDGAAAEFAEAPFDLQNGPLWRAALFVDDSGGGLFTFVASRLICDDDSAGVLLGEVVERYRAEVAGARPDIAELAVNYRDYTHWRRGSPPASQRRGLVEYWRQQLQNPPVVNLPTDRPRPVSPDRVAAVRVRPLGPDLTDAVHRLSGELDVSPYTVYLSALFVLMRRYTGQDDLIVGCPGAVRRRPEVAGLVGAFDDLLAVRVDLAGAPTFRDVVRRVHSVLDGARAKSDLALHEVARALSATGEGAAPELVRVTFAMPAPLPAQELSGPAIRIEPPSTTTTMFELSIRVVEDAREPRVVAEYRTELFDPATVDDITAHYARLTAALACAPDAEVARAALMSPAEREGQLRGWQGVRRSSPPSTIHGWFADQAARTPDAVAVVAADERITYRQLDARADALSAALRAAGASPGTIAAICLPRGIDFVVAVLAVLKSGAGFLPLDPAHPTSRLLSLLEDAAPVTVLATTDLTDTLAGPGRVVLTVDAVATATEVVAGADGAGPDDLAYVLYTSGSTGAPKGVEIGHRAVLNFVEAVRDEFILTPDDRMLGYASTTFDVSIFEMFGALLTGGRLCLALTDERLDIERLQRLLEEEGVTVTDLPPSVMATLDPERLDRLRIVFVGGEAFSGELVNRWNPGRRFFNGYGPTECTVTMITHECTGTWSSSPPIGRPIANHVAYVLDANLEPVPTGVPGELVIGGLGLARGYLNEPALTAEKFIDDPFGSAPGGRLYRTGDLVKRLRDGALQFLGRVDRQLKVRGMRIEPAEIESALASHPDVRQVHADVWRDHQGEPHLVGYVSLAAGALVGAPEIRAHLMTLLPAPVVPDRVVVVPQLPLTASGKVDRAALPEPDAAPVPAGDSGRPETERIIADEVFGEALGVKSVASDANFFALGGSSLQAAQAIFGIRRRFGVAVSVADFFREPTAAGLAAMVDRERVVRLDDDRLLDVLEQMSDEEVERIMRVERQGWAD